MDDSILTSVKKIVNVAEDVDNFDTALITYINTSLATLNQLGVGPEQGFMIQDATPTWEDFLGDDPNLNLIQSYVCLVVRTIFDPPTTSFAIEAMNKQIDRFEWRISVYREGKNWTDPNPPVIPEDDNLVLDGGQP